MAKALGTDDITFSDDSLFTFALVVGIPKGRIWHSAVSDLTLRDMDITVLSSISGKYISNESMSISRLIAFRSAGISMQCLREGSSPCRRGHTASMKDLRILYLQTS